MQNDKKKIRGKSYKINRDPALKKKKRTYTETALQSLRKKFLGVVTTANPYLNSIKTSHPEKSDLFLFSTGNGR